LGDSVRRWAGKRHDGTIAETGDDETGARRDWGTI
jgi:hypothetical protein